MLYKSSTDIKFADNTGSYNDAWYVRINFVKKSHNKLHMQKSVIVGHFISIVMVSLRVSMGSQDFLHSEKVGWCSFKCLCTHLWKSAHALLLATSTCKIYDTDSILFMH